MLGQLECCACGRALTNDIAAANGARWTMTEPRLPYCGDSRQCEKDALAEEMMALGLRRPL